MINTEPELHGLLTELGHAIEQSAVFHDVSRDRLFSAVVELSDPTGRLSFVLDHGRVRAGTGRLTAPPMVTFTLRANEFESTMSGDIHPLQLALTGRAKFHGNILTALPLHELLPEVVRLFRALKAH